MKHISRILSIFTALQLCMVNAPISRSGVAYAGEGECDGGMVWNERKNGCVLEENLIDLKIESAQCEGLSGAAAEKCYQDVANSAVDKTEVKEKGESSLQKTADNDIMKYGMPMIASFVAGHFFLSNKKSFAKCPSTSMWLLLGGAVAGMGAEIYAQLNYKSNLKKIEDTYRNRVKSTDDEENDKFQRSTDAQTAALEALSEQESKRINAEKIRQTGYTIAAGLYAGAVIAATFEAFKGGGVSCPAGGSSEAAPEASQSPNTTSMYIFEQLPELMYYSALTAADVTKAVLKKLRDNMGMAPAHAAEGPWSTIAGAGTGGALAGIMAIQKSPASKGIRKFIDNALRNAVVRGALAGVLGGYSYVLKDQAKRIKENSKKKKAAIDDIILTYNDTGGSAWNDCTPKQRKNPGTPACYCYNEDGTINQQRRMRQTCFHITQGDPLVAGKYGGKNTGYAPVKACLKTDGTIDKGCNVCNKKPDLCPTMAKANMGNLSLMKGLGMSSMVDTANDLATGNLSHGDLNVGDLEKKAARIEKAKDKLKKGPKTKDILSKMESVKDKWSKAAPGLFRKSLKQDPNLLASIGMPKIAPSTNKSDIIKAAKEKVSAKSAPKMATEPTGIEVSKKGAESFDFDFGGEEGGVEVTKGDIMDKEFKVTGDIHKNSDTNLFKILSLRYQRSGLRRLFDTTGRSKADAATGEEIHGK